MGCEEVQDTLVRTWKPATALFGGKCYVQSGRTPHHSWAISRWPNGQRRGSNYLHGRIRYKGKNKKRSWHQRGASILAFKNQPSYNVYPRAEEQSKLSRGTSQRFPIG